MIQEAYVSFETAKLLKEKEFDEPCYSYYTDDTHKFIQSWSMHPIMNKTNPCFFGIAAPTQQMAMRWLREVWNIVILVQPVVGEIGFTWEYRIIKFHLGNGYGSINGTEFIKYGFDSYEDAAEAAIKCCLRNLI